MAAFSRYKARMRWLVAPLVVVILVMELGNYLLRQNHAAEDTRGFFDLLCVGLIAAFSVPLLRLEKTMQRCGVVCVSCGRAPYSINIKSAMAENRCPNCGLPLFL